MFRGKNQGNIFFFNSPGGPKSCPKKFSIHISPSDFWRWSLYTLLQTIVTEPTLVNCLVQKQKFVQSLRFRTSMTLFFALLSFLYQNRNPVIQCAKGTILCFPGRSLQVNKKNVFPPFFLIMVNKHKYNPSLHDILEMYYDMFRGKNQSKNKDLFNSPDTPDHSDQDSNTQGLPTGGSLLSRVTTTLSTINSLPDIDC